MPRAEALLTAPLDSWVVLSEDETCVVAAGKTMEEVAAKAEDQGIKDPILIRTPGDWTTRIL